MLELLEEVLDYNEHRSGEKGSVSATQIIGNLYQTKLAIIGETTDMYRDRTKSIGAWLGTGMHSQMEKALSLNFDVITERYGEKFHIGAQLTITGTADILYFKNGTWRLGDLKSTMQGKFDDEQINKAVKQMSIYRWILEDKFDIIDDAHILVVGRARNTYNDIPIELMSVQDTEKMIYNNIMKAREIESPDCFTGKFKMCDYCNYLCKFRK